MRDINIDDVRGMISTVNSQLERNCFTLRYELVEVSGTCYLVDSVSGGSLGRHMTAQGMFDTLTVIWKSMPKFKPMHDWPSLVSREEAEIGS